MQCNEVTLHAEDNSSKITRHVHHRTLGLSRHLMLWAVGLCLSARAASSTSLMFCFAACSHLHVMTHAGSVLHPIHQEGHALHHARPRKGVQPVLRDVSALQDAVHCPRQRMSSQQPLQVSFGTPVLQHIR